jgi:isoleucyl-tRNA synthetase
MAEWAHQELRALGSREESIHLCDWPSSEPRFIKPELENGMRIALSIIEGINSIRHDAKIKLRWPLATAIVDGDENCQKALQKFGEVIARLTNVKKVKFGSAPGAIEILPGLKVWVDTQLTPQLKKESLARELIRKVQDCRKSAGMVVHDKIILTISQELKEEIEEFEEMIKAETGAVNLITGRPEKPEILKFEDRTFEIGIQKK